MDFSPPRCPAHDDRAPLYTPEFAADPATVYARLRERHGAIAPVELAPGVPANLVISYAAALEVLREPSTFPRDPRRWEQGQPPDNPVLPMLGYRPNYLYTDGAVHARLRGAVTSSLGRVNPHLLRGYVEHTARELIGRFAHLGSADLLGAYATSVALEVFNHLFGCPPGLGERLLDGVRGLFDLDDPEQANLKMGQAMAELIALKRREPGPDLPSWMIAHPARLTDEELLHQMIPMLGAGTELEQNLITNGVRLLLSDERFAGDLAGGSMPVEEALDEILWTDPPMANFSATYPQSDVDLLGARLPADQPLLISFAAANTDPELESSHRAGNRAHLAWGAGPHTCPAQVPARVIASAAIETLLDVLPDLRLAVPAEQLVWRQGPFHRALTSLPVSFTPVAMPAPAPVAPRPDEGRWAAPPVSSAGISTAQADPVPRRRNFFARWWRGN
ncbi:cytochrome P450 [Amycolatopsis sp. CA-230715]|uniref:cytochrome P450 n=1 Tax=Amycolatopsis sp. CA-230715 TaxID=2745196 RepID=UPI001C026D53|nr:cytochrome P450 [Amycolatopsis sp. CA-230715]QWF84075.1 Cytochrome P450 monooxygenase PikC [Amycolatopsis sp. CA-230715]